MSSSRVAKSHYTSHHVAAVSRACRDIDTSHIVAAVCLCVRGADSTVSRRVQCRGSRTTT
eukprot:3817565-Prymnesium_polylepis.3